MKKTIFIILITMFAFSFSAELKAQCDSIASSCAKYFAPSFVSDGQQYRALLLADQNAEFHTTFYGGSSYRIAACSGFKSGNLVFSVFDEERNLLFSSKDFSNAPFWDFKVASTLDVIIEATLDGTTSGCAVVLIGFKQ